MARPDILCWYCGKRATLVLHNVGEPFPACRTCAQEQLPFDKVRGLPWIRRPWMRQYEDKRRAPDKVHQCKTCPWKVGAKPREEIPNYSCDLHKSLDRTISQGMESFLNPNKMACHYSEPGHEFVCAGWLYNQLHDNNFAVRMQVIAGKMPVPEVSGPQHHRFEETLPDFEDEID